jgi:hypothetical protein
MQAALRIPECPRREAPTVDSQLSAQRARPSRGLAEEHWQKDYFP